MEKNAFLLFGIDYLKYVNRSSLSEKEQDDLRKQSDIRFNQWETYGNAVLAGNLAPFADRRLLAESFSRLMKEETILEDAKAADRIVRNYLEDIFGNPVIKKEIETSIIVSVCNDLGISRETFDYYVSHREKKDCKIKVYPMIEE